MCLSLSGANGYVLAKGYKQKLVNYIQGPLTVVFAGHIALSLQYVFVEFVAIRDYLSPVTTKLTLRGENSIQPGFCI